MLTAEITPLLRGYNLYFEPFFGGGAIFFDLGPAKAILSDINPELMNCYEVTKGRPEALIAKLKTLTNTEEAYYRIRASTPRTPVNRAARFLYLCTLSFNGIHRVNKAGKFNVPYGKKTHISPCDETKIHKVSSMLQSCELLCGDFETITNRARRGDCVYFDPPYTVAHGNNGFLKYNEKIFSWDDQLRLEEVARKLAKRGIRVVISNADHPSLRDLYSHFRVHTIDRWSVIAGNSAGRKAITECVFYLGD
jgi:DNA adenine methylase